MILSGHDRTYVPPRQVRKAAAEGVALLASRGSAVDPLTRRLSTGQATAWDLVTLLRRHRDGGEAALLAGGAAAPGWADRILNQIVAECAPREDPLCPDGDCSDTGFYGLADAEDPDILRVLVRASGEDYENLAADGRWAPYEPPDRLLESLDRETASGLAAALTAGCTGLLRRYCLPLAWLAPSNAVRLVAAADAGTGEDWTTYAIVDELDTGAVLNVVRLRPGPELERYENGAWVPDAGLLASLRGVAPPPLVELDAPTLADVLSQIDATAQPAQAASLVADAPLTVSPDPRAEKLREYWSTGKGGIKIRWGTPGDWKRCYKYLRKYMGARAKGYCQNLHKRVTGVWTGSRLNPGRRASASPEEALLASLRAEQWRAWMGWKAVDMALKDGVYVEALDDVSLVRTLTAGGFPVMPPDDWFGDPGLEGPTPLTVDDDGHVYGHVATFDIAHIGLPGKVHAPKSRSGYSYFKTGVLRTASGKDVPVGQLTLAGGHAPLHADAGAAVAHYDNTASAVADVNAGEDRYGVWVSGALRPEITPEQVRTLRASAPSGDWRPVNGNLELVAVCQVNVPGFPVARARVASGAITALVAAGARPLAVRKRALLADADMAERISALENLVYAINSDSPNGGGIALLEDESEPPVEDLIETSIAQDGIDDADPEADRVAKAREYLKARRREKLRARVHAPIPVQQAQPEPVG